MVLDQEFYKISSLDEVYSFLRKFSFVPHIEDYRSDIYEALVSVLDDPGMSFILYGLPNREEYIQPFPKYWKDDCMKYLEQKGSSVTRKQFEDVVNC